MLTNFSSNCTGNYNSIHNISWMVLTKHQNMKCAECYYYVKEFGAWSKSNYYQQINNYSIRLNFIHSLHIHKNPRAET